MTDVRQEGASNRGPLLVSGDAAFQCRICRKWKPVRTLARDCEARDARELGVDLEEFLVRIDGTS